jgi:hypothetical protein
MLKGTNLKLLVTELPFTNQTCETAEWCSRNTGCFMISLSSSSHPLRQCLSQAMTNYFQTFSSNRIIPRYAVCVQTEPHHENVKWNLLVFSWYSVSSESVKNHVWKRGHRTNEYYDRYTTIRQTANPITGLKKGKWKANAIPVTGRREPLAPACLSWSHPDVTL